MASEYDRETAHRPMHKSSQKSPQYSSGGRYEARYRDRGHRSGYQSNKRMNEGVYREDSPGNQRRRYNSNTTASASNRKSSHGQKQQSMVLTGANTAMTSYQSETMYIYDATLGKYRTSQQNARMESMKNDVRISLSLSLSLSIFFQSRLRYARSFSLYFALYVHETIRYASAHIYARSVWSVSPIITLRCERTLELKTEV